MPLSLETPGLHQEGALMFAEISAPPMNLNGPELVRDLVSFIQGTEADRSIRVVVFKSADPHYFISHVDVRDRSLIGSPTSPPPDTSW